MQDPSTARNRLALLLPHRKARSLPVPSLAGWLAGKRLRRMALLPDWPQGPGHIARPMSGALGAPATAAGQRCAWAPSGPRGPRSSRMPCIAAQDTGYPGDEKLPCAVCHTDLGTRTKARPRVRVRERYCKTRPLPVIARIRGTRAQATRSGGSARLSMIGRARSGMSVMSSSVRTRPGRASCTPIRRSPALPSSRCSCRESSATASLLTRWGIEVREKYAPSPEKPKLTR